jgi:hypothetical protein
MKKQYIQIGALVVVLVGIVLFVPFNKPEIKDLEDIKTGEIKASVKGNTTGSTVVSTPTNTYNPSNKEFPFNFTEKNLVIGTPFGSFKYAGFDYANYFKFSGSATVSGQVTVVKGDGEHNLGITVDKADLYKLPQYYFISIQGENGTYNFVRAEKPYVLCFGYYYPSQYDYNELLGKLALKAGEKVTVKIDNYKIIASKEHVGACASLLEIVE